MFYSHHYHLKISFINIIIIEIILIISQTFISQVSCSTRKTLLLEDIHRSIKAIHDNCQSCLVSSRSTLDETQMETISSRLSYIESKLERLTVSSPSLDKSELNINEKLSLIERSVVNSFDRLAKKYEELSETIRGLQTMAIINHNSSEEKIKKILNTVNDLFGQHHPSTNDATNLGKSIGNGDEVINELQTFWDKKLTNMEKTVSRHVTLAKDEVKEILQKSPSIEKNGCLAESKEVDDENELELAVDNLKSDLINKFDRLENQIKFSSQEVNFKLDSTLARFDDFISNKTLQQDNQIEIKSKDPEMADRGLDLSTNFSIESTGSTTISSNVTEILKIRRCQVKPDENSIKSCGDIPFKSEWKTCNDILADNVNCDGVYLIMMEPRPAKVWCDMTDNGGGWMVIMRRGKFNSKPLALSFNQNWFLYKYGFGDQKDEYWLGNEFIHQITSSQPHQLQIDLESYDGDCVSLDYGRFLIENEDKAYRLVIADAHGPQAVIAEQFLLYNNSQFNTRDRVNNRNSLKCGHFYGGWWFNGFACFEIFLTGEYSGPSNFRGQLPGIHWYSWKPNIALRSVQMKIKPVSKM